jgi:hypothetical protein
MRSRLSRLLSISMVVGLALTLVGLRGAGAATNFDVSSSGASAYVIGGQNNPSLTLTRGQTYTFNVTVSGHPFWIVTARGASDVNTNQFTSGVSGNGNGPGVVTFVVPASAPSTLFYQCSFHDVMGGQLTIVSPPSVPSSGTGMVVALGALLLLAALVILRQKAIAAMRSQDQ